MSDFDDVVFARQPRSVQRFRLVPEPNCDKTRDMLADDPELAGKVILTCDRSPRHTGKHHHHDAEGRLTEWWGD